MRSIRVTFSGGRVIETNVNGDEDEIRRYYLGQYVNFGDTDEHPSDDLQTATAVEVLDQQPTARRRFRRNNHPKR